MATSSEIKARAKALAEKTDVNSITPKEVGGIMYDLASHSENVLRNGGTLGIRKVYKSVSAMEADGINPVDLWGNPIKKGNLVVIYDGTTTGVDNNKVYAFMNPGWELATELDAGYATKEELSELGSNQGNIQFVGNGDNFAKQYFYLKPARKYRLTIVNPVWAYTTEYTEYKKMALSRIDKNSTDGAATFIINVLAREQAKETYEFVAEESKYNNRYVMSVRADIGETVYVRLDDITEVDALNNQVNMSVFSNNLIKVSDNEVQMISLTIRDINGVLRSIRTNDGNPKNYVFGADTGTNLVLTSDDSVILKKSSEIAPTDLILLFYYESGKEFKGGYLLQNLISDEIYNIKSNVKKTIFSNNLVKVSDNSVKFSTLVVIDVDGSVQTISNTMGAENPIVFGKETGQYLVLTASNTTEMRTGGANILPTDTVLLFYYTNGNKFNGGVLHPCMLRNEADILNNQVNMSVFSNNLVKVSENEVQLVSLTVRDINGISRSVRVNEGNSKNYVFGSNTGSYLVLTSDDSVMLKSSSDIVVSDIILLFYYTSGNKFAGGALLQNLISNEIENQNEKIADLESEIGNIESEKYDAESANNLHIAVMNKYAERFGVKDSTFLMPNGGSYVTARDMVKILLAAIADNKMTTLWGIPTDNIPVYGDNARVDELHSSYMDESVYPNVADLKNYYHIFGGKTGSTASIANARNLVIACKSNRDDAWLAGCILYANSDVVGNNRFSMMRDLFNALDAKRFKEDYSLDTIDCGGAYAVVVPNNGNTSNYFSYDNMIDIGVNQDVINQSHSTAKLLTGLVALDKIDLDELIVFTDDDPYGGTSGKPYAKGDKLYCVDAVKSMMITSSSVATRALARYVGNKVLRENNGVKLYSFRLANKTAYGEGLQSWIQWLDTPDYLVWKAKTGKEVTCASGLDYVIIDGKVTDITGETLIVPNNIYPPK